jgi:hypothetical protein
LKQIADAADRADIGKVSASLARIEGKLEGKR